MQPRTSPDVKSPIALVSGCPDNQASLDGRVNGLSTEELLKAGGDGSFTGSVKKLRDVVSKRMPPTQTPNYYVVGATNQAFLRSRAFSI